MIIVIMIIVTIIIVTIIIVIMIVVIEIPQSESIGFQYLNCFLPFKYEPRIRVNKQRLETAKFPKLGELIYQSHFDSDNHFTDFGYLLLEEEVDQNPDEKNIKDNQND